MRQRKTEKNQAPLTTEAKAARLREILDRVARRENEDAERANEAQKVKDRLDEAEDDKERDLLEKIQRTYAKYLDKKQKKAPRISKAFKEQQDKKDVKEGSISWKYVSYDDLDLLDLGQESNRTATLFIISLVLMILLLFFIVTVCAITVIVHYAGDEMEQLEEIKGTLDTSIFVHNLFKFLTIMPTVLIVLQIMINLTLILQENIDEVFFYIRDNGQGLWTLKGVFGLSLALLTGMLSYMMQQNSQVEQATHNVEKEAPAPADMIQIKHIITCILSCAHALTMMMHAQSKMKDAEHVYMKYLYDKHKPQLPGVDPKNVSSGEHSLESDGPEREVKFI